jgi:hypothetical protein
VIAGAAHPAGVPAVAPNTTGDTVSTNVRFVIVPPPMFVTTIEYVTGDPTAVPAVTVLTTVKSITGIARMKPVDGVLTAVVEQYPDPIAYAVFDTAVLMQTVPTTPVIVNVNVCPRPRLTAPLLHEYSVPLAVFATVATAHPTGLSDVLGVPTTGDIVSVTVSDVIVIVPLFVTTIRYVTGFPVTGEGCTCVFTIERFVTAGWITMPTGFVISTVVEHAVDATTYPVFEIVVAAHTTPICPLTVNVVVVPG